MGAAGPGPPPPLEKHGGTWQNFNGFLIRNSGLKEDKMNIRLSHLGAAMSIMVAMEAVGAAAAPRYRQWHQQWPEAEYEDYYEMLVMDRLSIGLAFSMFNLTDGARPPDVENDFLGNINKLSDTHSNHLFPIIEYQAFDYLSFGLTYMDVEAGTMNFNNGEGDGTAILKGPVITADLTYPLLDRCVWPHIGSGIAFLSGDFEEETWWHLGYSSPETWKDFGRPTREPLRGRYREIAVDDQTKAFFTIGVSFRPHPRLKLDLSYRRISLDPGCSFAYSYRGERRREVMSHGDFDMSGDLWLFSASYVF
jgi:hypothetical protein